MAGLIGSDAAPELPPASPAGSRLPLLYPELPTATATATATTFAEPGAASSFGEQLTAVTRNLTLVNPHILATRIGGELLTNPQGALDIFRTAERQTNLANDGFSRENSLEEAYDRRIKAVKDATGLTLENPERSRLTERELRRLNQDNTGEEPIDPAAYLRLMFEGKLREAREKHPDKVNDLTFGSIDDEAQAIAKGAEEDYTRARAETKLSTPTSLAASFAGSAWGMRRNPMFVGSLFAGPTGAVGRTVAARVVSSGVIQGLFNAGLTALEQPAVQAWRDELGLKSGVVPAIENVGMAFLFGAIPGAVLRGAHELAAPARQSIERVLAGKPEPGDIEAAVKVAEALRSPPEPPAPGFVRFFHGGEDPTSGGSRWVTTDPEYAKNFRADGETKEVHYVDIPKGDPTEIKARAWDEIDEAGGTNMVGRYNHIEVPEEWAKQFKLFEGSSPLQPREAAAARLGEQIDEVDKALQPAPVKDMAPQMRDDLTTAAQRIGDDPLNQPAPQAVEYVHAQQAPEEAIQPSAPPTKKERRELTRYVDDQSGDPKIIAGLVNRSKLGEETIVYRGHEHEDPLKSYQDGFISTSLDVDVAAENGRVTKIIVDPNAPALRVQEHTLNDLHWEEEEVLLGSGSLIPTDEPGTFRFIPSAKTAKSRPVGGDTEVDERIAAAQPQSAREAQMAATQALEDIGNRETGARLRAQLDEPTYSLEETFDLGAKAAPARSKDPLDKIPMMREDGTATMVSAQQAARAGERETQFADLIRACK